MDKPGAIKLLKQLIGDLDSFIESSNLDEEFNSWYNDATKTICSIFGDDSDEAEEFRSVTIKLPWPIPNYFERQMENIRNSLSKAINKKIEIKKENHYTREQLNDLREILLDMMLGLRK